MHLYFITRGIKQQRDLFVNFMQTQMFKWKRKNLKTGKEEIVQVQGSLRPVELWEYVFPEESLNEVLTILDINPYMSHFKYRKEQLKSKAIRKMLGKDITPVPDYKKVPTNKYVELRGITLYPIGIKKDRREKAEWGYEQEML